MTRPYRLFLLIAVSIPASGCFFDSLFGSSSEGTGGPAPDGGVTDPFTDGSSGRHDGSVVGPGYDGSATYSDAPPYVYYDGGVIYMDVWYPIRDGGGTGGDGASGGVTNSGPLSTGNMRADMSVQSYDGVSLTAYATLRHDKFPLDPNPDDVVLSDGDTLTAQVGNSGTQIMMTREPGTPGYTARYLATLPQPQTTSPFDVIIAFHRTNGAYGAPYSKVTMAAPFAITSQVPAAIAHQSMLPIKVAPAIDTSVAGTYVEAFGACISGYYAAQTFDGTGSTSFDVSRIQFVGAEPSAAGCDITLRVRGDSNGQVDSAFQRGSFGTISGLPGTQAREAATHLDP
jgi:hypothetical protein